MKYRSESGFILFCIERRKNLILFFGAAILISFAIYMLGKTSSFEGVLIEEGEVISVDRSVLADGQIALEVTGEYGESSFKKPVLLKKDLPAENNNKEDRISINDSEKAVMELSRIVRDINRGSEDLVELPQVSPEGVSLTWKLPERGFEFLLPLLFPVLALVFLYRDEQDKKRKKEKIERESIIRELPGFNNKLVLLMESGLIYEDAIIRVSESAGKEGVLYKIFLKAIREASLTNGNAERVVSDYAREKKIPELSRLVSIVIESRARGTDLREKLISEGEILWEKRKRQAEEQGKLADTKLAMPLGMMLVSLLIVTAAPALLQF